MEQRINREMLEVLLEKSDGTFNEIAMHIGMCIASLGYHNPNLTDIELVSAIEALHDLEEEIQYLRGIVW